MDQHTLTPRTSCYARLETYLHATGSRLSTSQALDLAVDAWLAAQRAKAEPAPPMAQQSRGYQWKCLFLPHDTELRMRHDDASFFARVAGNDIVFRGRSVSPRGMTMAIAGAGRNAKRVIDQPERRIDRRRRETDGIDDCFPCDGRGPACGGGPAQAWPDEENQALE